MKIEIGESLMLSWLKHIKECKITQLNWKPSNKWVKFNETDADNLFEKLKQKFHVFKESKKSKSITLNQLLKQAEIDVLGLNIEDNKYYAVDVAYHEQGLNYGPKKETINKVLEKLLRSALVLLRYFNVKEGDIIFASPIIKLALYNDLKGQINDINDFMKEQGYNYNFMLIANDNFSTSVLDPIKKISCDVADTSELFMRALQLSNLCKKNLGNKNKAKNNISNGPKIGATVKSKLQDLLDNKCLSPEEINNLQDKSYCKKTFDLNFPLLINKNKSPRDKNRHRRYWDTVFDDNYFACSQWQEKQRTKFEDWYKKVTSKTP